MESKKTQNTQMKLFMNYYKMKIVCFIMTNVFGEEDQFINNGKIVSSLIYKVNNVKKENKNLYINTSSQNEVNLIYVEDIVKILEHYIREENECFVGNIIIFNINGIIKIGELANKIKNIMNYNGLIEFNDEIDYKKTNIMKPNLSKMKYFFPSFEFTDIDMALIKTIKFYIDK